MNTKKILTELFSKIEYARNEVPSAGTRFRLMGLVADIAEVTQAVQLEVLDVVSREAVLDVDVDADTDIDYMVMAEEVLAKELQEDAGASGDIREQTQLVNEALGALNSVLVQVSEQLDRHHKNDEFERLYEAEKRRYLNSGTASRARKTFEEWKILAGNDKLTLEDIEDYRLGKLLKMFEKGVLNTRVEQIQRVKRFPGEVDFEQLDDDHPMKKSANKHYAALRKLVDYRDGCLVVDPVRVGRHFYVCRHEENARTNRNRFLEYMHKISLAQELLRHLKSAESCLPAELATPEAMKYWSGLQEAGLVDVHCQLLPSTTRKQAMYIADLFSDRLQLRSKWKLFQDLWHLGNLAQEKWDMQETGRVPARYDDIGLIFDS